MGYWRVIYLPPGPGRFDLCALGKPKVLALMFLRVCFQKIDTVFEKHPRHRHRLLRELLRLMSVVDVLLGGLRVIATHRQQNWNGPSAMRSKCILYFSSFFALKKVWVPKSVQLAGWKHVVARMWQGIIHPRELYARTHTRVRVCVFTRACVAAQDRIACNSRPHAAPWLMTKIRIKKKRDKVHNPLAIRTCIATSTRLGRFPACVDLFRSLLGSNNNDDDDDEEEEEEEAYEEDREVSLRITPSKIPPPCSSFQK